MQKLRVEGNSYFCECRKPFQGVPINPQSISEAMNFAYDMAFGEGYHRSHRTGGQNNRKGGEIFCNTFQGKVSEICLKDLLVSSSIFCNDVDFKVYGKGLWDEEDLIANEKTISIKSSAHFSHLLLLETEDYDNNGNYLPNVKSGKLPKYDYYVMIRVKPDIKSLFKTQRWLYKEQLEKKPINNVINSNKWSYDFAGWISHKELVKIIQEKQVIPQNALLNGKIKMDANNYYVQSGEILYSLEGLIRELKYEID